MLKKNDDIILEINDFGTGLSGVGRNEGMAVFVPGAIKGEKVRAHIIKVTSKYAVGKLSEVMEPSHHRVKPPCPVYEKCGGCSLMHIDYGFQLRMKSEYIADCFRRNAGMEINPPEIHGMDVPFRYRNKSQFPCAMTEDGPRFGLYEARSHRLIPAGDCLLADEGCKAIITAALGWMEKYSVMPYDETTGRGTVRHLVVRTTGSCLAMLVVRERPQHTGELVSSLRAAGAEHVALNFNPHKTNVILGEKDEMLYGGDITANLLGLGFRVSPRSFFQINTVQTEKLYSIAREWACGEQAQADGTLYDIYCGTGTIGLTMAERFDKVVGIEINPAAVEDARKNAASLGISNAEYFAGAAEDLLPKFSGTAAAAVLDPPRRGCEPSLLKAVASLAPERIVYISCNPATLARDVGLLREHGYALARIEAVDMFPQTEHVETVCLLYHQKKDFIYVPYEPKDAEYLKNI